MCVIRRTRDVKARAVVQMKSMVKARDIEARAVVQTKSIIKARVGAKGNDSRDKSD
jgi:hypothetical protein